MNWIRKQSARMAFIVAAISLMPVLYCGMFNYATADDYAKSYMVRNAILSGGNLIDIIQAGVQGAIQVWYGWEGTWASNFVLAMQPGVWGEHIYAITVPLCILYAAVGTGYLLYEILICRFGMTKRFFWLIYWIQLFLFLQYMPYIRGGMFWYTGMAHYVMPMFLALLMMAWMLKWARTHKMRYSVYMLINAVYIGGSHYQQIILVLLALLSVWLWEFLASAMERRSVDKRIHLLWAPMVVVMIGLVICVIAPGNAARGGDEVVFSVATVALMPVSCVIQSIRHIGEYAVQSPFLAAYAVLLWGLGWRNRDDDAHVSSTFRKIPGALVVIYLFLMYASTEAAAIYASDNTTSISGGYFDIVYQSMLIVMTIAIPFSAMRIRAYMQRQGIALPKGRVLRIVWGIVMACLALVVLKPAIKGSAAWTCYTFASSGRLDDFVIQMEERVEILNDPDLTDVYVPEMNSEQGPFMHLQLSQDATNYTNTSAALYYNKNTITAVPREEYYREYALQQGHDIPEEYKGLYSVD